MKSMKRLVTQDPKGSRKIWRSKAELKKAATREREMDDLLEIVHLAIENSEGPYSSFIENPSKVRCLVMSDGGHEYWITVSLATA